ncbi:hypothetical protein GCM10027446_05890 [Angustibacter peucedani]
MSVLQSWSRLTAVAVAVVVGTLVVTGCGVEHRDDSVAPGATADAAAAQKVLVSPADLPEGFAASGGQSAGYRQTVCGVDIEPTPPVQQASARFSQGPVGPFVEQRVRVYPDDSATAVVAALRKALATCTSYQLPANGTAPAATMAVRPLDLPQLGDESVAWRQVPQTDLPITTDVVLIRSGRTVVLMTSYALKEAPPETTVKQAATAAANRLGA